MIKKYLVGPTPENMILRKATIEDKNFLCPKN